MWKFRESKFQAGFLQAIAAVSFFAAKKAPRLLGMTKQKRYSEPERSELAKQSATRRDAAKNYLWPTIKSLR
jgi:hypothetical protein